MDWWDNFNGTEQVLFTIGIVALVAFVLQTTITLIGGGLDGETDVDHDADIDSELGEGIDMLEFFTIRNLLSFLTGLSWTALGLMNMGIPSIRAITVGAGAGIGLAALNILVLRMLSGLAVSGNVKLSEAIGQEGKVTLLVPANSAGIGKVMVTFSGRTMELYARTKNLDALRRGHAVRVTEVSGDNLVVEPLSD